MDGAAALHTARVPHRRWAPLAFVVATLLVLAVVPFVTRGQVRSLGSMLTDVTDPAGVLVNDLQAALATELLALGERAIGAVGADAEYAAAREGERRDLVGLDSLVRRIGPEATESFGELRSRIAALHEGIDAPGARPAPFVAGSGVPVAARAALAAAERLDRVLVRAGVAQRQRIRAVQRWDQTLPILLVPCAVGAMIVVVRGQGRLERFAADAETGRRRLADAAATREGLLRGITHDLKNPLGATLGYAELLEDGVVGSLAPEQRHVVVRMRRLVELALGTIGDLLELSRIDAGHLSVRPVATDVVALVAELVADYRPSARAAGLELELRGVEAAAAVETDPARVHQILGNLLSNAVKYTPAGGVVSVAVERSARGVAVHVEDTGVGIAPALRGRVFEEFFRIASTDRSASGAGVGLAISRRVAVLLGGDLRVGDRRDGARGARFTLSLPPVPPSAGPRGGADTPARQTRG